MRRYQENGKRIGRIMVCLCVFFLMTGTTFAATETDSTEPSETTIDIYQRTLKLVMDQIFSVIESIEKDESLSLQEKKRKVIKFLKVVRYGPEKKDYFWLSDIQAKMIMDPYLPDLVGKDMISFKDPNGKEVFVEILKAIRKFREAYVNYLWPRYEGKLPVPKVTLVRLFKPWDWIVGTGLYLDTIEAYEEPPELFIPLSLEPLDPIAPASNVGS